MIDRKPFENGSNPGREREEAVLRGVSRWFEPGGLGLRVGTVYRWRSGAGIWEMSVNVFSRWPLPNLGFVSCARPSPGLQNNPTMHRGVFT